MMRIAKIADDEGGTEAGALATDDEGGTEAGALATDDEGGTEAGALPTGASSAETGTGGNEGNESPRGRGGEAIGRGPFELAFAASASSVASPGSVGMRSPVEAFASPASGIEGCVRRRIGGGWMSDGSGSAAASGSGHESVSSSAAASASAENEMLGAIGGFKAFAAAKRSGPSPGPGGRPEAEAPGGAEAAPESRLGFGGGASLRDKGGVESCTPVAGATSITPLAGVSRGAPS